MISADEWATISMLIDEGWPGEFTASSATAWRVFLDEYDATQVLGALKVLVARGSTFRPSVAEVVAQIRDDPTVPTFAEACQLIFGPGGVMHARTKVRKVFWEIGERDRLNEIAGWERASDMHPLIGAFIEREGFSRLRDLNLEDEQYGAMRRAQLQKSWDAHCEAMRGRELAAVAQGRRGELGSFDPLVVLRLQKPAEITSGGKDL